MLINLVSAQTVTFNAKLVKIWLIIVLDIVIIIIIIFLKFIDLGNLPCDCLEGYFDNGSSI